MFAKSLTAFDGNGGPSRSSYRADSVLRSLYCRPEYTTERRWFKHTGTAHNVLPITMVNVTA